MTVQPVLPGLERPSTANAAGHRDDDRVAPVEAEFLRRVAHDIASPAGVTITVLEELAIESHRPELVAMARRGLRRLLRLSEQLALTAELEGGTLCPEATIENARSVVEEAVDQAVGIDGRRDVVTSCDLPKDKVAVNVDRRLVASVLREVIGNGLRLASSRVAVDVTRSGDHAVVRVSDDGPGLPSEVLATLGQRLTSRSSARGLGLSLAIAKEVLAAHGGDLRVEPSPLPPGRRGARGAAVIVRLPLA